MIDFPFVICHFSFFIAGRALAPKRFLNGQMKNGK